MKFALVFGVLVCWLEMFVVVKGIAYFRIKHKNTAKVIEAVGTGPYDAKMVARDNGAGADAQKWYIDSSGTSCTSGDYFIRSKKDPTQVLVVAGYWPSISQGWVDIVGDSHSCVKRWIISGGVMKNMDDDYVLFHPGYYSTIPTVEPADGGSDQQWICDFS